MHMRLTVLIYYILYSRALNALQDYYGETASPAKAAKL